MTTLFTRARSLVLSMIGFIGSLRSQPTSRPRRSMNG